MPASYEQGELPIPLKGRGEKQLPPLKWWKSLEKPQELEMGSRAEWVGRVLSSHGLQDMIQSQWELCPSSDPPWQSCPAGCEAMGSFLGVLDPLG